MSARGFLSHYTPIPQLKGWKGSQTYLSTPGCSSALLRWQKESVSVTHRFEGPTGPQAHTFPSPHLLSFAGTQLP